MEFQVEKQKAERLRLGLLTCTEVAAEIGITRRQLTWHLSQGVIVAPTARITGRPRAYYQRSDLPQLRAFFEGR